MGSMGWIKREGAVGELPVEMDGLREATLLDVEFVDDDLRRETAIRVFDHRAEEVPTEGDVCILKATVVDVVRDATVEVWVTVLDVEFVRRTEGGRSRTEAMMRHLDDARDRGPTLNACENCREITATTKLTTEERYGRDLHHCANEDCGRLLSTTEYERWMELRGR